MKEVEQEEESEAKVMSESRMISTDWVLEMLAQRHHFRRSGDL